MSLSLNHLATASLCACPFTFEQVLQSLERMVADSDCTSQLISDVILTDPMLTALVISRANGAGHSEIIHIGQAVSVLGLASVMGFCDECEEIPKQQKAAMAKLWAAANASASMTHIVADHSRGIGAELADREICTIIGLLHDIGSIISQSMFADHYQQAGEYMERSEHSFQMSLKEKLGLRPSDFGALLAKTWHLPNMYANAIRYHRRPMACNEHLEVACVTHVAHHLVRACGYQNSCESYVEEISEEAMDVIGLKERHLKDCVASFLVEDEEIALYEGFFSS